MKKILVILCVILIEAALVSCSSSDNSVMSDKETGKEERNNVTESSEPTEESVNVPNSESAEPVETEVRIGSRDNVMQIGENITLPYSDWNSNSDGEITVSVVSSQDGKTTMNISLNSQTKNSPFIIAGDQMDYLQSPVYFLETDDPMSFVWNGVDIENYLIADESAAISVGGSQDVVYNTSKQYVVIITSVLKETDNNVSFDSQSSNYNCYYTFIQLY